MEFDIVFATRNEGKLLELRALVADLPVRCRSLAEFPDMPEVEETGETFLDNAVLKAHAVHAFTGLRALADDSGLCVAALNGRPGVHSARYGGVPGDSGRNNAKLLCEMAAFAAPDQRAAWFQATLAFVGPRSVLGADGVDPSLRPADLPPELALHAFEGRTHGRILLAPQGDSGFGYDPLFWNEEHQRSFAELSLIEKNRISHRGRAFRDFRSFLEGLRTGISDRT